MNSIEPLAKTCGSSTHSLQMNPDTCTREEDCNRTYHLHIPEALCDPSSSVEIGTLPVVFAVHCFGCNANSMVKFEQVAKEFNFILVRPEGVESSWNAKYCCGYALDRKLDDTGFFSHIIDTLDASFDFMSKEMVYGVGWSNGGYMVTYSANLFRSIAPIAGYQYSDIMAINGDSSTGIFQHHSLNDHLVSFDGCCTNSTMKQCCCGISKEGGKQCKSVTQTFDIWARKVNQCSGASTTTFKDEIRGIECRSGQGCESNTTLCVYEKAGHFTRPTFSKGFPMFEEVGDFFARDACSVNDGHWSSEKKSCSCDVGSSGNRPWTYCSGLTTGSTQSPVLEFFGKKSSTRVALFAAAAIIVLIVVIIQKYWKVISGMQKKKDGWQSVPIEEQNEIELQRRRA